VVLAGEVGRGIAPGRPLSRRGRGGVRRGRGGNEMYCIEVPSSFMADFSHVNVPCITSSLMIAAPKR
jgi:hypothetical protein